MRVALGHVPWGPVKAPSPQDSRALGFGFALLTWATAGLMVLGALVRAHGAGLACPDWPLCFGQWVPAFDVKIAFEWSHRVLAGSIAVLFVVFSATALRLAYRRRQVGWPLAFAALLLGVQIVLGGLTVLLKLEPWTVIAHLLVASVFVAVLRWVSLELRGVNQFEPPGRLPRGLVGLAVVLLGVQLYLGGWMSSHAAGLACAAFPTCDGESLLPVVSGPVGMHVLHRVNAVVLLAVFSVLALASRGRASRIVAVATFLVAAQIGVGALNVLMQLPVEVTGLHSALAVATVLVTASLAHDAAAPVFLVARREAA